MSEHDHRHDHDHDHAHAHAHAHGKRFRAEHAHKLDDPQRAEWLPVDAVLAALDVRPGMRVADVGAGTGYFAIPLARAVSPGGEVLAVDVQPEMLDLLRPRVAPGTPITLVQAEATKTTLPEASLDLALLANVWHEIDDQRAALAEAARVLKPGGRIAILDWRADLDAPPGPPRDHRVALASVEAALAAAGWTARPPREIGPYSYLLTAARP